MRAQSGVTQSDASRAESAARFESDQRVNSPLRIQQDLCEEPKVVMHQGDVVDEVLRS